MSVLLAIEPSWNRAEHILQVRRQIRCELHPPAVARVVEREARGVQKRPLQMRHGADVARHAPLHTAVQRIADDRMADGAEMYADLMRAPRVNRHLAERQPRQVGCACDSSDRLARASRSPIPPP